MISFHNFINEEDLVEEKSAVEIRAEIARLENKINTASHFNAIQKKHAKKHIEMLKSVLNAKQKFYKENEELKESYGPDFKYIFKDKKKYEKAKEIVDMMRSISKEKNNIYGVIDFDDKSLTMSCIDKYPPFAEEAESLLKSPIFDDLLPEKEKV